MKVAAALAFLAAGAQANSFSAEDQAIWIDRHNYFRTTGLPWAAGDMRRIGWSSDQASKAEATAAQCTPVTAAGVNSFQSTASNSSSVIDDAIQQWVVETSMTTLRTLAQPGSVGVDVGTGVYNAYSQVLWASTTSVGCATASCSGGDVVVCEYSPAGNTVGSPWYVHGETASDCPSGTTAKQGLCVMEGDAANDQIAAIPAGKLTYEVYPAYVASMQTLLIEAARAIANGSNSTTTAAPAANGAEQSTPAANSAEQSAPVATTAAPTVSTSSSDGGSATQRDSTKTAVTSSSGSGSEASAATKSGKTTTSSSSTDSSNESSAATKSGKTSTSAASTDSSSESSKATKTGKTTSSSTTDSSESNATKQTSQISHTSDSSSNSASDESAPGTVKASSDTGSTFTNQAKPTTTESSAEQTSSSEKSSTEQTSSSGTKAPSTASTESTTSISNQSGDVGGISNAGLAGMILLAVVGIAAFGVVMSYKRNQRRQREIMRDGGIRII
ncbi:unnamed protein product [Phytophthora fragariaefolia]|uniref:Unnamed protein product n=1 Tax=Phytophthora fragariaefolia TaxID=1490495 RepID=A0A9W6Y2Y1_9STRA|nr:unnamed protein product [Phytophthora fragariaefolia]